ncbi:MAG: hypothetical protein OH319_01230 [Candidatus Parvarchaeota archaeon]|nr:hypothetical protein [Candidatus Jingweiarchaeum tengchongense]MCW1297806.1 hypothetical protein [Candidatus Jingweiarchaeum tengchongense]MCW1299816.1 hypothetical protein [Candidatus Jingweiarchaeum tengchongense]MCW1304213.1 hypothetical protein [Candidatus Jingweiarchaeum tengchongense]MCW1305241.1 hypothetical protein [Candidatus Jingweiarchaeum tengchongense]
MKNKITLVGLGELGLGTKYGYPEAITGLTHVLKNEDIDAIIITGGLLPRVPRVASKRNSQYLDTLASDEIDSIQKASIESKKIIEPLKNVTKKAKWYYACGEEDRGNLEELVDVRIAEALDLPTIVENLKTKIATFSEQLKSKKRELELLREEFEKFGKNNHDKNYLSEYRKRRREIENEIKRIDTELREDEANLVQRQEALKKYGFIKFTGRYPLKKEERDLFLEEAKREYKELIFHSIGHDANIILPDSEANIKVKGMEIKVAHNSNRKSDVPLQVGIQRRVMKNKFKNVTKENVPELDIEGHHAGGFRVYIQRKRRNVPEQVFYVQLPTLHHIGKLEEMLAEGINNWDVKRLYEGYSSGYASGAVIMRKRNDGVREFEFFSSDELAKIKDTGIESLRNKPIKIEALADMHIGCTNEPSLPNSMSNYALVEAYKNYQRIHGLPNIIVALGDMVQAGPYRGAESESRVEMTRFQLEQERAKIMKSNLSNEEKLKKIEELDRSYLSYIPITNISEQKMELRDRWIKPHVHKVLDNGGKVLLVSGDHYNKTLGGKEDEATEIANMIDERFRDKVYVLKGNEFGTGKKVIDNLRIYAQHKPMYSNQDEVIGGMKHLIRINEDCDIAFFANWHHPGFGYINSASGGVLITALPSFQPDNPYVSAIGKQSSTNGFYNIFVKPGRQWFKIEVVTDDALLNYVPGLEKKPRV